MGTNALTRRLLYLSLVVFACLLNRAYSDAAQAPRATEAEAIRFLRQASWGPNSRLILAVQKLGIDGWLKQQFKAHGAKYPSLKFYPESQPENCNETCARDNYSYYQLQKFFFRNALTGPDQLRQRVAFALSQIFVTSEGNVPMPAWMRTYQQMLYDNAFGNYRQLLYNITLNPTMGRYLDMLNNRCQRRTPHDPNVCRNGSSAQPNENYAREILQLFSIGTFMLNQDGTYQVNGLGQPIPTYDQATLEEFARVFTGWVLAPSLRFGKDTAPNYKNPMVVRRDDQSREMHHDRGAKSLLNGFVIPADTSAELEIAMAIDNIAGHPNVAPFITKHLIRHLVTSNPSPAYVARVAQVFAANAIAPNQLEQVVRAILTDPEARNPVDSAVEPDYGKLNEPVLFMLNFLRAFEATSDGVLNGGSTGAAAMNQDLFRSPTVFNYYPADYEVPGEENLIGPVFGIFSSKTSITRANFVNRVLFSGIPADPPDIPNGTILDLSDWVALASTPAELVNRLSCLLLNCAMSAAMQTVIVNAVNTVSAADPLLRAQTAIYLIATSSHYQVQR